MPAVRRLALAISMIGMVPVSAVAQRSASLVAGVQVHRDTPAAGAVHDARVTRAGDTGHAVSMANGALIGAGIGIAAGLIASPIVNAQNADHSEDAMTYIVLPAFGAFFGLIIGGIVGWRRGS